MMSDIEKAGLDVPGGEEKGSACPGHVERRQEFDSVMRVTHLVQGIKKSMKYSGSISKETV